MTENNRIEYKRELTDNLEKEVVAFLNYKDGGVIYIGLDKDGNVYGVDEEDFFSGFSVPRNKEIMRVFRDLEIVEQLGSGIPRILKTYGRDAFEIRKSFVRVVFYYEKPFEDSAIPPSQTETRVETRVKTRVETRVKTSQLILETLAENPTMTLAELAERIGKSVSAVERASAKLVKEGKLRYVGPQKGGHWQVLKGNR
jgi:predicted HTH transcriptional regulator